MCYGKYTSEFVNWYFGRYLFKRCCFKGFLIYAKLQEQLDYLREKFYYMGSLTAFFDVMEIILKTVSDSREEMRENIRCNPNYYKDEKLVNIDDVICDLKTEILDKGIQSVCGDPVPIILKEKEYIKLYTETCDSVRKFSEIKKFTFKDVDECKKALEGLRIKYEKCEKKRNFLFIKLLFGDVIIIILSVAFLLLLGAYIYLLI